MIIFAIPLRSKESSHDWGGVIQHFNDTLQSIFSQKDSSAFRCIVACNEIPELSCDYDERLEFIRLNMPTPHSWIEMARDKFWKLTEIAVRIREILEQQDKPENGIYVMPIDADDFINSGIAKWCEDNPDEYGAVSKDGYVWDGKKRTMLIYPKMHTFCGSCNIIKMYREDLPEKMPFDVSKCHDKETAAILNAKYPIRFNHNEVVDYYASCGKQFKLLPFRSTVYLRDTGDNISSLFSDKDIGARGENRRFHPIAFLRKLNIFRYKLVTQKVKKEFGIID